MSRTSSHGALEEVIRGNRQRIAGGERPLYHAMWTTSPDGSVDVRIREIPLIHLFVPDNAGILDGARLLVARTLEVDPGSFDVAVDRPSAPD